MNEREKKAAKAYATKTQGKLLFDFLETRRSGRADATFQNHRGTIGWIEFKAIDEDVWKRMRDTTCPLKGKFEPGQLAYLRERISWHGRCYVMLFVGSRPVVLNPMVDLESVSKKDLLNVAAKADGFDDATHYLEHV